MIECLPGIVVMFLAALWTTMMTFLFAQEGRPGGEWVRVTVWLFFVVGSLAMMYTV